VSAYLYRGEVVHVRQLPPRRHFRYPAHFVGLDVDELPALDARLRLFGHNRGRPVAVHDRDYLDASDGLAASIRRSLGTRDPGGRIHLVTHTRVFGYVFNPVSFFLCQDRAGVLAAVIAEVNNTYGGAHRYVLEPRDGAWEAEKRLFVSPFLPDEARYRFTFPSVGARLEIAADLFASPAGTPLGAPLGAPRGTATVAYGRPVRLRRR